MTLFLCAPQLRAAVTTSALTGRVLSAGAPAANVTVTATSSKLQAARTTSTTQQGNYWLGALPPGEYEVVFSRAGLQTLIRRVTVQLGRVARADAKLEPSEDEESVTSTVTTISVVHDTAMSVHRDAKTLDRLPYAVDVYVPYLLAPGLTVSIATPVIDEIHVPDQASLVQAETVDAITLYRGITPVEHARAGEAALLARTRSGGNELTVSIRDTITNDDWNGDGAVSDGEDLRHYFETSSGGRIIPDRLWFFAGGWSGKRADSIPSEPHGFELKLSAQLTGKQSVVATHIDQEDVLPLDLEFGTTVTSLVHTALWTSHFLSEIVAGHSDSGAAAPAPFVPFSGDQTTLSAKVSRVLGEHVLSGGVEIEEGEAVDTRSVFIHDRIWLRHLVLNAGLRYQDDYSVRAYTPGRPAPAGDHEHFTAQLAAMYDLRGRGRNAIAASASRYALVQYGGVDELTLGYVMALGSTGSARLDVIHRDYDESLDVLLVQLDSSYRLFDRFEAGLNYTWAETGSDSFFNPILPRHLANAWFSADVPVGAHAVGGTIAYRHISFPDDLFFDIEALNAVDFGLRYTFPVARVGVTLAGELQNAFDSGGDTYVPRSARVWVRARL